MKRLIIILLSVCILILAVSISVKPIIILLVRKHVGSIFVQSRITTGGYVLRIHREIRLFDIEIKRQGAYDIKIKEAAIQYNLFSVFKPDFLKLSLKEVKIYMNRPDRGIREFAGYLKVGPGNAPIFGYLEVSGLALDLNTLDVTAKAVLSWGINLPARTVDYLDVKLDIFKMFGVEAQDAFLKLGPLAGIDNFKVAQMKYDKLAIDDIKGKAALQGNAFSLSGASAKTLDGGIQGDFKLEIDKGIRYLVNLRCVALDIEKFVRDFELQEKFN
ncbi:MAG: hypothetical protein ABSB18_07070, partial [Candidatus Omnitrophota bacterium]